MDRLAQLAKNITVNLDYYLSCLDEAFLRIPILGIDNFGSSVALFMSARALSLSSPFYIFESECMYPHMKGYSVFQCFGGKAYPVEGDMFYGPATLDETVSFFEKRCVQRAQTLSLPKNGFCRLFSEEKIGDNTLFRYMPAEPSVFSEYGIIISDITKNIDKIKK